MSYLKEKAQCNFKIAELAVTEKCYDVAVNRFYYYIYQHIMEFLYIRDEITERSTGYNHRTTISTFLQLIKAEETYETNRSLTKLWSLKNSRHESDYNRNKIIKEHSQFYETFRSDFNDVRETLKNLSIIEEQNEPDN